MSVSASKLQDTVSLSLSLQGSRTLVRHHHQHSLQHRGCAWLRKCCPAVQPASGALHVLTPETSTQQHSRDPCTDPDPPAHKP
eukprot:1213161-Rhodomonas_salina.2